MKFWERWGFGLLTLAVTASGFVYLWMKYVVVNDDPFAVTNHPWEGVTLAVHVLTAPALILVFGVLLQSHVIRRLWKGGPNRVSGLISLGTFAAMALSGYLLQVVTSEAALSVLVWLHVGSGTIFALSYLAHIVISIRLSWQRTSTRPRVEMA